MNVSQVMNLLEKNENPRGVEHWKRLGYDKMGYDSLGIGLTQLRKLAKKVGRDHELAQKLWKSKLYDARVIGLLIDEPKKITREQAEAQVEQLDLGMLPHVFGSCDATLAKSLIARQVAADWTNSRDGMRRRCSYLLLYELSKDKKKSAPDDAFFLEQVARIRETIGDEDNWVKDAMLGALLGIGKRNAVLNRAAVAAARAIGRIEVDYGDNGCEPVDLLKHLTNETLLHKLGVTKRSKRAS